MDQRADEARAGASPRQADCTTTRPFCRGPERQQSNARGQLICAATEARATGLLLLFYVANSFYASVTPPCLTIGAAAFNEGPSFFGKDLSEVWSIESFESVIIRTGAEAHEYNLTNSLQTVCCMPVCLASVRF
jgi:hypothetical protein